MCRMLDVQFVITHITFTFYFLQKNQQSLLKIKSAVALFWLSSAEVVSVAQKVAQSC